jgi:hypothetical protein
VTTCTHCTEGGSYIAHLSHGADGTRRALCPLADLHRPQGLQEISLAELEQRDAGAAAQLAKLPPGGLLQRRNPSAPWHRYDPGRPLGAWFWAKTCALAVPIAVAGFVCGIVAGALGSPVILVAGWVRKAARKERERLAEVVL